MHQGKDETFDRIGNDPENLDLVPSQSLTEAGKHRPWRPLSYIVSISKRMDLWVVEMMPL